jgi:putative membrane protein
VSAEQEPSPPVPEAGAAAGPAPTDADDATWRRLDSRMLVVQPVRELLRLLPLLAGILIAGSSTGRGGLWGLAGAGVAIALGVLRWFTTTYRVGGGQVQVRRGLLRRDAVNVPLDRVRTVDISASALHRVLGLTRVTVGTGMSDTRGEGGLRLDGLSVADAQRLRSQLLGRPDRAAVPAAAAGEEVLAQAVPAWLRYAPFTLSGFLTVFVVLGFAWRIVTEARIDPRRVGPVTALFGEAAAAPLIGLAVGVLVLLAVVAAASTMGYVLAFWGFRLVRSPGGALQVSRGLVSTRATTIEERRLRGVEISEPLLLRLAGGARVIAIATGLRVGRGAERGGTLLLPPAPDAEARRVAGAVLRTSEPVDVPLAAHGRAAHRRRYTRVLTAWLVLVAALLALGQLVPVPGWLWVAALALLAVGAALAFDRYRALGHALAGRVFVSRRGSLIRRRAMLASDGIIGWNVNRSFFQRRAGLATLVATTAAGRQGYEIQDVPLEVAVRLADEAVPGLLTPFLERPGSE